MQGVPAYGAEGICVRMCYLKFTVVEKYCIIDMNFCRRKTEFGPNVLYNLYIVKNHVFVVVVIVVVSLGPN